MNRSSLAKSTRLILLTGLLAGQLQAQTTQPSSADGASAQTSGTGALALVGVGADERVWSTGDPQTGGKVVELATGMNYWNGETWTPSDPTFDVTAGGFAAQRLQYKVDLSADLNKIGAVKIVTPDGITLNSTPIGIGLYDAASGQSAIIAALTNCSGVQVSDNRIVYENAFAGVCADIVYTIELGSFQQDVVITGRLNPADYGFPTNTTRIQIFTEFYNAPEPDSFRRPLYVEQDPAVRNQRVSPDLVDEVLGFGEFVLGTGRAATLAKLTVDKDTGGVPVAKQFVTYGSRTLLVESVDYGSLREDLDALPDCGVQTASIRKVRDTRKAGYAAVPAPVAPGRMAANKTSTRMAKASVSRRPGVVIDYEATIGGTLSGTRIFQGDTTYFLTNAVTCSGAVTIEGGAIFKYPTNANVSLKLTGTVTCKTSAYRPAIFTAADDNTVGDTLSTNIWPGYTGTINTNGYANPAVWVSFINAAALSNVRVRYAQEGIRVEGADAYTSTISHVQLVNCIRGIVINGSGCAISGISVTVNNSLIANVQKPLNINFSHSTGNFYHATVDSGSTLLTSSAGSANGNFYNSVLANITTLKSGTATLGGNHDGFYICPTLGTSQYTNTSNPFQSVGAGNYYLTASNSFLNVGITNGSGISASLLKDLKTRTTYPPVVLTNSYTFDTTLSPQVQRDTDLPDLGYHYDPIDYAVNTVTVTNATLILTNGVALATFGNTGIWLQDGSQMFSEGTPTNHNHLARYFDVQEQGTNWGGGTLSSMVSVNPYNNNVAPPSAQIRFTDFDGMAASGYHVYTAKTNWTFNSLLLKDCSFNSESLYLDGPTNSVFGVTNNLFERVTGVCTNAPQISFYNNLYRFGFLTATNTSASSNNWTFKDNSFDSVTLTNTGNALTASHNAYINMATNRFYPTNANDIVLTSFTYKTGPLGNFYQATNSVLIDAGSRNATNAGLYHYTVTTNLVGGLEVKETNSVVDIGFHYVAVDSNGVPIDTDGDGLPDYLEDYNGNGVTDTGETDWLTAGELGLKVWITEPKSNSNIP